MYYFVVVLKFFLASFKESAILAWNEVLLPNFFDSPSLAAVGSVISCLCPTSSFATLKLLNQKNGVLEVRKIRLSPDYEALKILKG